MRLLIRPTGGISPTELAVSKPSVCQFQNVSSDGEFSYSCGGMPIGKTTVAFSATKAGCPVSHTVSFAVNRTYTPCTLCQDCIAAFQALPPSIRSSTDPFQVSRDFYTYCINNASYPDAACTGLKADVASSLEGNLAKRPAAVCLRMGVCSATAKCNATALDSVTAPLDACSANGLVGGGAVRVDGEF